MGNVFFQHNRTEVPDASEFEKHCHSGIELLYVVEGEGYYSIEGRKFPLKKGTMGMFRISEYHFVCPDSSCPYERYVINFDVDIPFGEAEKMRFLYCNEDAPLWFDSGTVDPAIPDAFRALSHAQKRFEEGSLSREALRTLQRALISSILLLLPGNRGAEEKQPENTLVSSVIAYLNDRLSEKIKLEELSGKFYVSKSYLCRKFRKETGISVLSYLNTKRLMLANTLLLSGIPANEAARKSGFEDYSVFYRAYKKQYGVSPRNSAKTE